MLGFLRRTHICRYLDEAEAKVVLEHGSLKGLQKGEILFETGDPGDSMFAILQGSVNVYQVLEGELRHSLTDLKVGDIIGEFSVVDGQMRAAHAVALEDSVLFQLSRDRVLDLMRTDPPVASKVLWAMLETITIKARANLEGYEAMVVQAIAGRDGLPKASI